MRSMIKNFVAIAFVTIALSSVCWGQRDGIHVDQFAGPDIATKVNAAQNACFDSTHACVIVFDASLSAFPTGTLPSVCTNCVWVRYDLAAKVNISSLQVTTLNAGSCTGCGTTVAFVQSDFTTAANTSLQNITGLTFTLPAQLNTGVSCYLLYSQATATGGVAFGISASSGSGLGINAQGKIQTALTAQTANNITGVNTSTPAQIVTATPGATGAILNAEIHAFIQSSAQPNNVITIMTSTAVAADAVTIKQGSYCVLVH